jgi:CRISPR-associated protein Cmr6
MPIYRDALAPLYTGNTLSQSGSNAGLILSHYLREQNKLDTSASSVKKTDQGQKKKEEDERVKARDELLDTAISSIHNSKDVYTSAFKQRRAELERLGGTFGTFKIEGRLIIGLGASNVLETGLTLNHIYGTPIIPGSSLKGLASHYCSTVWGACDAQFKRPDVKGQDGKFFVFLFGTTEDAGFLTFHDAWIKPDSLPKALVRDVMTPHHGSYYMKEVKNGAMSAPSDFDDPNPVTFLSTRGDFEICVSCETCEIKKGDNRIWELRALDLLAQALSNWGIGGKTSSGYGFGSLR